MFCFSLARGSAFEEKALLPQSFERFAPHGCAASTRLLAAPPCRSGGSGAARVKEYHFLVDDAKRFPRGNSFLFRSSGASFDVEKHSAVQTVEFLK